jgi:hypothetical protein
MTLVAVVVLVVALTTLFTLFVRPSDIPPPEPVSPARHLEDRKAVIYENLRDLQFEYRVGKLSDADYQQTKLTLQKELAGVMAEIDRIAQLAPSKTVPGRIPPEKAKAAIAPAAKSVAAAKSPSGSAAGNTCPHCGAKFPNPMKFCGECGKAMG